MRRTHGADLHTSACWHELKWGMLSRHEERYRVRPVDPLPQPFECVCYFSDRC
jgi:hypothetical protein